VRKWHVLQRASVRAEGRLRIPGARSGLPAIPA
jgi:hypothetical protein